MTFDAALRRTLNYVGEQEKLVLTWFGRLGLWQAEFDPGPRRRKIAAPGPTPLTAMRRLTERIDPLGLNGLRQVWESVRENGR